MGFLAPSQNLPPPPPPEPPPPSPPTMASDRAAAAQGAARASAAAAAESQTNRTGPQGVAPGSTPTATKQLLSGTT